MPKKFTDAIKHGAKVRTKTLSGNKYIKIAITKSGKSIAGEVHKRKK